MAFVQAEAKAVLADIGSQLDSGCYPRVYNGGIVQPSKPSVEHHLPGVEMKDEQSARERRPATRSWQGSSGRQGAAHRPWSSGRAAPVIDASVQRAYEAELDVLRSAYPDAKIWLRGNGVWLRTESLLLHGLTRKATFLTHIPFDRGGRASAWGYWTTVISASWIGPRHTNFPDGSVCAFEPRDGTWSVGDTIVKLLDLYTLWALRHLHLEIFGRWPGHQSVPIPYERLQELKDDELCGCDRAYLSYSECCKPTDLSLDRPKAFADFLMLTGGHREPPSWVARVVLGLAALPEDPDLARKRPLS